MQIETRKNGLDLLKIIGLMMIIMMHASGNLYNDSDLTMSNMVFFAMLNAIGNTAVSCFMLISGYFGLKFRIEKVVKLWITLLFFSTLSGVVNVIFYGENGLSLIRSFLPVTMCKSWYFTCYFIILSIAGFIEKFIDSINKKQFLMLILILMFWLSIFPTFLYFSITNDRGKGIMNLLLIYLVGRYINKYLIIEELSNNLLCSILLICFLFITILNMFFTIYTDSFKNHFASDNSIFIIIESISLFALLFKFYSHYSFINKFAAITPVAFMIEPIITKSLYAIVDMHHYSQSVWLPIIIVLYSFFVVVISYGLFFIFDTFILNFLYKQFFVLFNRAKLFIVKSPLYKYFNDLC